MMTTDVEGELPPKLEDIADDDDLFASAVSNTASLSVQDTPLLTDSAPDVESNGASAQTHLAAADELFAGLTEEIDLADDGPVPAAAAAVSSPLSLLENDVPRSPPPPMTLSDDIPNGDPPTAPAVTRPSEPAQLSPSAVRQAAAAMGAPAQLAATSIEAPRRPVGKSKHEDDADEKEVEYEVDICVAEHEKRGEGMGSFVVYKVVTKAKGVPGLQKCEYVVWRRFSDFLGLHDKLVEKYAHEGRIVPPPPDKNVVAATRTKMTKGGGGGGGGESEATRGEFVERRRLSLERFVRRVARHPVMLLDCDFRDFVSVDMELPRATQTAALSGAGVKRMFRSVGDAFSRMAYRMDENDRWFEEKQNEVADLDDALRRLQSNVDSLVHFRRELAESTEQFCKSLSLLSSCEENSTLASCLSQLAETQEKIGLLHSDQADKDYSIFSEMLRDYVSLLGAAKEVLYERVRVWQNWQTAQQTLTKKREIKTRLELAGKADRLPAAKGEVQEAEQRVEELEDEFHRISKMIRTEMRRFDGQRVRDFKATLLEYLESLSLSQQQLVKYWEAFLPQAKAM